MRLLSSIEFVLLAQVGMTNDLTKRKENLCRWEFYIADGKIEIGGGKVGSWLSLKMGSNSFFFNFPSPLVVCKHCSNCEVLCARAV